MIGSLQDFKDLCLEIWERWHIDTPSWLPITQETSVAITEAVLATGARAYCGPGAWGCDGATTSFRVTQLINPITGSTVILRVVNAS